MWPTSATSQAAFLLVSETLYLYSTGASTTQIAVTALTHTLGIAGGSGLSRYRSKVSGFLGDEAGSAKIATRAPRGALLVRQQYEDAVKGLRDAAEAMQRTATHRRRLPAHCMPKGTP